MIGKALYLTIIEILAVANNNEANMPFVSRISSFLKQDIVDTLITTVISIAAGYACSFKSKLARNLTIIIAAFLFNIYIALRVIFLSESWGDLVFSLVIWVILCVVGIVALKDNNIVSRKKIGRMVEKFTATANPNKDICIFAGDIDFFGEVIENREKKNDTSLIKKRKKNNNDIKVNSQFKQLSDTRFRKIHILCIKPPSKNNDKKNNYHKDRIRIGYIKSEFGDRVNFKFVNDDCLNCSESEKKECKCSKKNGAYSHPSLPDTTLRGRIVTDRETDAKCVAITTKKSSKKEYIVRQYGSGEKESSLYDVLWKIWWKKCEDDKDFINECIKEYNESVEE